MKRPTREQLVQAVAKTYAVPDDVAHVWLIKVFGYHKPRETKGAVNDKEPKAT